MTVNAFKKLGMLAGTEKGTQIRLYYIELEKHLMAYGLSQAMNQLKERDDVIQQQTLQLQNLEEECETLRNSSDGTPIVYIYDMDVRKMTSGAKELKIGVTEHYRKRSKPFKGVTPFGRMVFNMEVPLTNLKIAEKWIHTLLAPYHVANEVFKIGLEEAKMWIIREVHSLQLSTSTNASERIALLSKLVENEKRILSNDETLPISTREISTQTDDAPTTTRSNSTTATDEDTQRFDQFIQECCITHENSQVSSTDITGKFRIWARTAEKETFHKLLAYMKKRFAPCRLRGVHHNSVVNGFSGVELTPDPVVLSIAPCEAERFVYANFNYVPNGKVLMTEVVSLFEAWKSAQGQKCSKENIRDLKIFLKMHPHVLVSNVWCDNGNGQGYYGLAVKSRDTYHRKPSTTAQKIEKRDKDNNFLKSWTTIAKAAEDEGVAPAFLSRAIKSGKRFDDGSTFVKVT